MATRIGTVSPTRTCTRTIRFDLVLKTTCQPCTASATDTTSAGRAKSVTTARTIRSTRCASDVAAAGADCGSDATALECPQSEQAM